MGWELTLAAADPDYVPDERSRSTLVCFFRRLDPGACDVRCEVYPAPVYWQDWTGRQGLSWADVFCPFCNAGLSDWFAGLRVPRLGKLDDPAQL
jgi:hypothetical protein